MKSLVIITIMCSALFSNLMFATEETSPVTPIKELKVDEINFEQLPKESTVGNLEELVTEESSPLDSLLEWVGSHGYLYPFAEGMGYVNGVLCHIGNYPRSTIYTVMEGPQYGLQTVVTPDGYVMYVNYDYALEYTPQGVILHHNYSDSEVITGSTQVISFY